MVPPRRVSPFFHFTCPKEAQSDKHPQWDVAYDLIHSFPKQLNIESEVFAQMKAKLLPQLGEAYAPWVEGQREVELFALCFLAPKFRDFRLSRTDREPPANLKAKVYEMLEYLMRFFEREREVAQLALNALLLALMRYELHNGLGKLRDSMGFSCFVDHAGVADGVLLAFAMQGKQRVRRAFYETWMPARPLLFARLEAATREVREEPMMLAMLIQRFPPRFPNSAFEREFVERVYQGVEPVPLDVGRQALAVCCHGVLEVWRLLSWPALGVVQERLFALGGWRPDLDEVAGVVYGDKHLN